LKLVPASSLSDFKDVYSIMLMGDFPMTPPDFITAYACLKEARNFLVKDGDKTIGWVGYHSIGIRSCSLDVCIMPEYQGKWLTKGILKEIFGKPLKEYGLEDFRIDTDKMNLKSTLLNKWHLQEIKGKCIFTNEEYERAFGVKNGRLIQNQNS